MALNLSLLLISTFILSAAQADVLNSIDAQTCTDLCKSCNGVATFEDNRCECNIEESIDEGAECVLRMRREATEHGLDVVSCDSSNDNRSTRCLLGSKLNLGPNDIDQVAKYFMDDGPMTGTIFQAPPYTHTQPPDNVRSSNSECLEQPSLFVLNTLDTTNAPQPVPVLSSPRSQHILSSPRSQHLVSSPQSSHLLSSPQSSHIVSSPQSSHLVSSPQSSHLVSSPQSLHFLSSPHNSRIVSNPQTSHIVSSPQSHHFLSSPQSSHVVSSPQSHQFISSSNNGFVGAPKIITQPKETIVAPKINFAPASSIDNCGPTLGKTSSVSSSPIVGDINPNLIREQSNGPTFFQILGQQLSRPMFGIPHAIQTVSQTPGLSDLVNAPANLLYTFLQRLNANSNQVASSRKGSEPQSVKAGVPKVTISNPNVNSISPIVGAQIPTYNYNYPTMGSPLFSVLNPTVGVPAATHVSYIQQMPASISAPMSVVHSPIVGSISPYNNFVPQVPATYVVGAPLGLPYYSNYNTAAAPQSSYNALPQYENSPGNFVEHNVEAPNNENAGLSFLQSLKKICKKSTDEEESGKTSRDVKSISDYVDDEEEFQEMNRKLEKESVEKQAESDLSQVSQIDRTTTTQKSSEKISEQNFYVETLGKENFKLEKTKSEKSMEKLKMEKEIKIKNKAIKEIVKKPTGEKKGSR